MITKTIPFDMDTAKKIQTGEIKGSIKTTTGKNVRIICFDRKSKCDYPIVALIDEEDNEAVSYYDILGLYEFASNANRDLVLEVPDNGQQFKPFDRVLCRDEENDKWVANLYSHMTHDDRYPYCVFGGCYYKQCIPYKGNEHLVGTTDKPKEE